MVTIRARKRVTELHATGHSDASEVVLEDTTGPAELVELTMIGRSELEAVTVAETSSVGIDNVGDAEMEDVCLPV